MYRVSMFFLWALCFFSGAYGTGIESVQRSKNVLVAMSGSISCYKAASLVSLLRKEGYIVKTVATSSAMKFIGSSTLEGLTGYRLEIDTFEEGSQMQHIALAKWADILLICPATGDIINGIAAGRADDLVKSICLAFDFQEKPFLIAPSMNTTMLKNPITQESIKKLGRLGVHILPTEVGELACGDYGEGRLLNPEALALYVKYSYSLQSLNKRKILITSGGTSEDIDGVREITNFSSGKTGAFLADYLTVAGHTITLLRAKSSVKPTVSCSERLFSSSEDLDKLLQEELGGKSYDAVIQLAAVSDFVVDHLLVDGSRVSLVEGSSKKISSDSSLAFVMKKNKKIIDDIKSYSSNPNLKLVGFKLTHNMTADEEKRKIQKIFDNARADYVVHNELSEITESSHPAKVYFRGGVKAKEVSNKEELAWELHQALGGFSSGEAVASPE